MHSHRWILALFAASLALGSLTRTDGADNKRLAEIRARVEPGLKRQLTRHGLPYGAPTFIRIFKQEKFLELWIQPKPGHPYQQFRRYPISNWGSGSLGPKLKEGDGQAPEGFYTITRQAMNPSSNYHLSFNLGFPNRYDRHHHRTGSHLMVHGNKVSIGCYAMTDPAIEEIYLLVEACHNAGHTSVPAHCFPFQLTDQRLAQATARNQNWLKFWKNLKTGYLLFEKNKTPPTASLDRETGTYTFTP